MYWECHHPNWRSHIFQRGRLNHQPVITNHYNPLICGAFVDGLVSTILLLGGNQKGRLEPSQGGNMACWSIAQKKRWFYFPSEKKHIVDFPYFSIFYHIFSIGCHVGCPFQPRFFPTSPGGVDVRWIGIHRWPVPWHPRWTPMIQRSGISTMRRSSAAAMWRMSGLMSANVGQGSGTF